MPLAGSIIRASDLSRVVARGTDVTADVGPTSGTTPLDVITASAFTPPDTNRRYRITARIYGLLQSVATDQFELRIMEGATQLDSMQLRTDSATFPLEGTTLIHYVEGPTAVSHTYKMTIVRSGGTGTATIEAGSDHPIQLAVEYVGEIVPA